MKHVFASLVGAVLLAVLVSAGGSARPLEVSVTGKPPVMGYIQVRLVNQPVTAPTVLFPVRVVSGSKSKPLINRFLTGRKYRSVMYKKLKKLYPVGSRVRLCVVVGSSKYVVSAACPKTIVLKVRAGRNKVSFTVVWKAVPPPPTTTAVTTTTTTTSTSMTSTTTTTTGIPIITLVKHPTAVYWADSAHYNIICVGVNEGYPTPPFVYFGIEVDSAVRFWVPNDQDAYCFPAERAMPVGSTHTISTWVTNGFKVQIDSGNGDPASPPADSATSTFTIKAFPPTSTVIFYFVKQ